MDVDRAGSTHGVRMGDFPQRGEPLEVPVAEATRLTVPTGTVTFLVTDIEESTKSWAQASVTSGEAVARHYAVIEERVAVHGGVLPVELGEGDSVVAVFTRASDAVAAAIDVQRALAHEFPGSPVR